MTLSRRLLVPVGVAGALLLAGCDSAPTPLTEQAQQVNDLGLLRLPNSPYSLHGYKLVNRSIEDHYVYFLEKNGEPVAGTEAQYDVSHGKSHTHVVTNALVPPPADIEPREGAPEQSARERQKERDARLKASKEADTGEVPTLNLKLSIE